MADQDVGGAPQDPEDAPAKKAVAKKAPSKKTSAKKAPAKKAPARKAPAKQAAPKKAAAKKTAAKATKTPKKTTAKRSRATPATTSRTQAAKTADAAVPSPPDTPAPAPDTVEPARRFPPDPEQLSRPWLASYPPLVPATYPYPDVPLTRLLDDAAKDFPDSPAVEFMGTTLTYRRLHEQVDRFASALQALGVQPGDRVGIAMANCPQHVIAFFAVLRVGGVVVALDPAADSDTLGRRINDTGCSVLVVLDPVYASVAELKGRVPTVQHVVATAIADMLPPLASARFHLRHRRNPQLVHKIAQSEGVLRFSELVRRHPPTVTQHPLVPERDLAVLAFEPGGTRAVMLTHRNLLANVFQLRLWIPDVQAGREVILCAVPLHQPFGVTAGLSLSVLSAATMVLVPSEDRSEVLSAADRRHPTLFPATRAMVEGVVDGGGLRKHDLTSIRACLCDANLDPETVKQFEDASGGRLREGLAVSEASPMTHANPIYGKAKAHRIGLPLTDTQCALVDPQDRSRLAEPGAAGELAVSGPQVFAGYWNRPDDTAGVLVDGWLLTGRLAEVDDDGYYCVTGEVRR